jgi:hypothetical protein
MLTRQDLLALAVNTGNIIAKAATPSTFQLEQRDRIITAAHAAGITDEEIARARNDAQ